MFKKTDISLQYYKPNLEGLKMNFIKFICLNMVALTFCLPTITESTAMDLADLVNQEAVDLAEAMRLSLLDVNQDKQNKDQEEAEFQEAMRLSTLSIKTEISFDTFKQETKILDGMREGQKNSFRAIWFKYKTIDETNRVAFFFDLNELARKYFDIAGTLRNGKILGQQAKDIKKYINDLFNINNDDDDEKYYMDTYHMSQNDFKETYGSLANQFGAKMQILKTKEAIINWATTLQDFEVNKMKRKLTAYEAELVWNGIINGDF